MAATFKDFLTFAILINGIGVVMPSALAAPSWVNPRMQAEAASSGGTPSATAQDQVKEFKDSDWSRDIEISKIDDGMIYFSRQGQEAVPPPLKTKIVDAQFLSALYSKDSNKPYLLLSGMPCKQCQDRRFLYLIRADGSSSEKLLYPGQVRDRSDNRILHESRAYYGQCLANKADVFVSIQSEKIRRMRYLQPATFVAEARAQFLEKETIVRWRSAQRIRSEVIRRSQGQSKSCFEIKGYDRKTISIQDQKAQEGDIIAPNPVPALDNSESD